MTFASSRMQSMVMTANLLSNDVHCASCAGSNPTMARMVQGVPVRVCGTLCARNLVRQWSAAPRLQQYSHLARMISLAVDRLFGR